MKFSFPVFIIIAIFIVSCGNSANNQSGSHEGADSLVSKNQSGLSKSVTQGSGTLTTSGLNGRNEDAIDSVLDRYEIMISDVRHQFFKDDHYMAPPGHQYHVHIHPVIELYEDLHARQDGMTTEQLSRFRKLNKRIMAIF